MAVGSRQHKAHDQLQQPQPGTRQPRPSPPATPRCQRRCCPALPTALLPPHQAPKCTRRPQWSEPSRPVDRLRRWLMCARRRLQWGSTCCLGTALLGVRQAGLLCKACMHGNNAGLACMCRVPMARMTAVHLPASCWLVGCCGRRAEEVSGREGGRAATSRHMLLQVARANLCMRMARCCSLVRRE